MNKNVQIEGVSIKTNVGQMNRSAAILESEDEGQIVGKVRHTASRMNEGIEIVDTSGRNIARNVKPTKTAVVPAPAPKAAPINTKMNPRIRIAVSIDPNFPKNWSFEGKLAERLARVKEHGPTEDFLEALYAAEGDQMRKVLQKEFPKQFRA